MDGDGTLHVDRLVTAFDCGAVVNPDNLANQIEGAVMMGLGGALFEAIDFADGQIRNASLSQYRVPRLPDLPEVEVVLIDQPDQPSAGGGETPIIAVAPAIATPSSARAASGCGPCRWPRAAWWRERPHPPELHEDFPLPSPSLRQGVTAEQEVKDNPAPGSPAVNEPLPRCSGRPAARIMTVEDPDPRRDPQQPERVGAGQRQARRMAQGPAAARARPPGLRAG